ncbi:uncharacterized protein LOC132051199 isoform X2 [Lycium ferocissimum]|uniref:uncharacterized protein LOC132051199 isoform X2 n=1 Tax=Lycium ferocissimum TaxID=112874 RepID=UPI002815949A|nr:uncharacterized protein LOC132051199 isoform X2 [Lycium ferocissimum]
MLEDIRIKLQVAAEIVHDVALSAPQANQDSDFVFMANPGFASSSQPISEAVGPSKSKRKAKDKVVAPSSSINQPFIPSRVLVDEDDDESELDDEDDQPILRPRVFSEAKARLKLKKLHQQPTGARKIGFKGDENGVSIPTNLPYSPRKLAWKANHV